MPPLKDLTGMRFGRLTVLKRVEGIHPGRPRWLCCCDCGNTIIAEPSNLKGGNTKSCGCLRIESNSERIKKVNEVQKGPMHHSFRHGMSRTKLNWVWQEMKQRCFNPNRKTYKHYGGRGITVCDEWRDDFMAFRDWAMANGYRDDLTIDRIDSNKGYSPDNCRWATMAEQNKNKRAPNGYKIKE